MIDCWYIVPAAQLRDQALPSIFVVCETALQKQLWSSPT